PVDPFTLMAKGSLFLTRPGLADYVSTREHLLQRAGDVLGWVKSGELKVRIDRVFAMVEAGQAQERLTSRQSSGKILLAT
ncbi:MAG: zinc-binding dehydrogenase, partial [Chloroflexi bacterium]|nr:zinc-binding dehydrogenase [Chloroflexota bacterium]